jgi:alkanesulfonate monooxygenase SsuD/methylene tetrahydromethanopterin reductase-like flavin-dependent oxidoreductase (luciferase family)
MILVDEIREYNRGPARNRLWCHMASDDLTDAGMEELHAMAQMLGLQRGWFQDHHNHPHYDLPPPVREAAIHLGAVPVTSRELVARCSRLMIGRRAAKAGKVGE